MKCDHCGTQTGFRHMLRNVHFETDPVSRIESRYGVCSDCRDRLDADPDVTW